MCGRPGLLRDGQEGRARERGLRVDACGGLTACCVLGKPATPSQAKVNAARHVWCMRSWRLFPRSAQGSRCGLAHFYGVPSVMCVLKERILLGELLALCLHALCMPCVR